MRQEINPRHLNSACRNLVEQYSDVLEHILQTEIEKAFSVSAVKGTQFETLKETIWREGVKEGLNRFLAKINEYASKEPLR